MCCCIVSQCEGQSEAGQRPGVRPFSVCQSQSVKSECQERPPQYMCTVLQYARTAQSCQLEKSEDIGETFPSSAVTRISTILIPSQ